jgi:hypothetical protein
VRKELLKSDKIQSIVDARAQEIWNNHPAFKNKRTETARRIRHLVAADIEQQFGKQIPPGWGPAEEKMEIDRIRKRL